MNDDLLISIKNDVVNILYTSDSIDISDLQEIIKKYDINMPVIIAILLDLLQSFFMEGRSKDFDGPYDDDQLQQGAKVEMEHTDDPIIAVKIAKDHLAENAKYYTYLKKMEKSWE
jgi:hypothetical protein